MVNTFDELLKYQNVELPITWSKFGNQNAITYFCLKYENVTNCKTVIEKQIVITSDSELYYYAYDNEVKSDFETLKCITFPLNIKLLERAIVLFAGKNACIGGPNAFNFPGI